MDPPRRPPPLCTLPPGPGPPRLVCYCEEEAEGAGAGAGAGAGEGGGAGAGEGGGAGGRGGCDLYVTDAAQLWSTCLTPDGLAALGARAGLSGAADLAAQFRAACERRAVAVTLQEDGACLTLAAGPRTLDLPLSKVPAPQAASRLRALTLGLAERVCHLERRLAAAEAAAASPPKKPQPRGPPLFLPDADPQRGGPGPGARRRCPGESLINPGFKSKRPAGGVAFDDP